MIIQQHKYVILTCSIFIILLWKNRKDRNIRWIAIIVLLLPLVNIAYYILAQNHSSVGRYVTTTFYVIPLLGTLVEPKHYKVWVKSLIIIVLCSITIIYAQQTLTSYWKYLPLPWHNGRYIDGPHNAQIIENSQKIQELIDSQSIIILSEFGKSKKGNEVLFNSNLEMRVYRYFLQENIKGGDIDIELQDLESLICDTESEYILLINTGEALKERFSIDLESNTLLDVKNCSPLEYEIIPIELP